VILRLSKWVFAPTVRILPWKEWSTACSPSTASSVVQPSDRQQTRNISTFLPRLQNDSEVSLGHG
jgi:hypothetical protein